MKSHYGQSEMQNLLSVVSVIGDASNILIMYELIHFSEKSFNELKRMTGINAVTLSKKLSVLRELGLVDSLKAGKENRYFVTSRAKPYKQLIIDIEQLAKSASPTTLQSRTSS